MGNDIILEEEFIRKVNNQLICQEKKNKKKNVKFCYEGNIYNMIFNENESFSSIFKKFKEQYNFNNINLYFISNGTKIKPEMKLNQIDSLDIVVHKEGDITGGNYAFKFTDISKQVHEEHYFSNKAPSYRVVSQGINIYGICKGKTCKGYKKEVICPLKKITKYNLIENKDDLECPECGGNIIQKTLGFHLCKYRIKGKKFFNDKIESFEFEGIAKNKDSIQYYNPDKNGETTIVQLIIEVTEYL